MTVVYLTNTSTGLTWTVPSDWNSSANTIEVIGAGGGGRSGADGGAGGGYSKISNLSLTAGNNISYQVGAGGAGGVNTADGSAGGDTWFNGASLAASSVGAKGGGGGVNGSQAQGGAAGSGVGTTKNSGGNGGFQATGYGDGGGGAAGPGGNGATGGNETAGAGGSGGGANGGGAVGGNASTSNGGAGGASITTGNQTGHTGGAGGSSAAGSAGTAGSGGGGGYGDGSTVSYGGGAGGAGTEWDASHGSGGGGGGGGFDGFAMSTGPNGGNGGLYGGGGGSSSTAGGTTRGNGGSGGQGIIVITYTPLPPTVRVFDEEHGAPRRRAGSRFQNEDTFVRTPKKWVWMGDEEQHTPRARRYWRPQQPEDFVLGLSTITASLSETFNNFTLSGTALVAAQAALNVTFDNFTLAGTAFVSTPPVTFVETEQTAPRHRPWHAPQNEELQTYGGKKWVWPGDEEQHTARFRRWRSPQNDDPTPFQQAAWVWQGDEEQHRPARKFWRGHGDEDFFLSILPSIPPPTVIFGFDQEYSQPRHRTWRVPQNDDPTPYLRPLYQLAYVFDEVSQRPRPRLWRPWQPEDFVAVFTPPAPPPLIIFGWEEEQHGPRVRRWHVPQNDDPQIYRSSKWIWVSDEEQHVSHIRRWRPIQPEETFLFVRSTTILPVRFGWEEEQHKPRFRSWHPPQNDAGDDFNLAKFLFVGIGKYNFPPVRLINPANAPLELWIGQTARSLNQVLTGKLNATTSVTLTPGATSTVLFDSRLGISSHITLMPLSTSAATALSSGQIWFEPGTRQVTIHHPASSAIDQAFGVLLIG